MIKIKSYLIIILWSLCGLSVAAEENNGTSENNLEVYESDVTLSYDFEEKLVKLVESFDENKSFVLAAIKTLQDELKLLKEVQEKGLTTYLMGEGDHYPGPNLNVLNVQCPENRLPESCYEVNGCKKDFYSIMIPNYAQNPQTVFCDLKTDNGGWTVIQRRQDGTVNFNRNWTEYTEGFGHLDGEFFIGLEKIHHLTTQKPHELYIILRDFEGTERYAKYSNFKIDSEINKFKLTIGGYSGNAGDDFKYQNGQYFSTWDQDNDTKDSVHCANKYKSGWWFKDCFYCNLNGKYMMGKLSESMFAHGMSWSSCRGLYYSLKFTQMMIRPRND